MSALVLEGVTRNFGDVTAVDTVCFRVDAGEVMCLLGPSGCGKTTVLRIAAGLEMADAGTVKVGGQLVDGEGVLIPPEKRRVGMVFQDYALFPHLTVMENVMFGVRERDREHVALDVLHRVGMSKFSDKYPHTLSGGEQQRVALARALAPRPTVMLMDEPFSGLDFRLRDRIGEESLSLLRELGTATLLVTHNSEEAMRLSDHIALMRNGRIVQQGSPFDIYSAPLDEGAAEFFSEVNRLDGVIGADGIQTVAGLIEHSGTPLGTPVRVVFRPEAVRLTPGSLMKGLVVRVRPLGPWTLAELKPAEANSTLIARLPPYGAPALGEAVHFSIDPNFCFVFRKGSGKVESA